jgi:hypothetical protein
MIQEVEQSLQRLAMLVREQQQDALHGVGSQVYRYICKGNRIDC